MRYWIIGLLIMCLIVAGGIFLSSGFAGNNRAIDEQGIETPQTNSESSNMLPNNIESLTTAPSTNEKTAPSKNVSVAALTCTIKDSGEYVIDLRYNNSGIENRSIIIDPSGVKLDMLPNKTYRYDLYLTEEVSILNISVDDGTELQVNSPNCTTQGWSGSDVSGFTMQEQKPSQSTPPPPVPELSPLVLTLAGISGLLLLSRTRKN